MKKAVSTLLVFLLVLPTFAPFLGASVADVLHVQHTGAHHAHEHAGEIQATASQPDETAGDGLYTDPVSDLTDNLHLDLRRPEQAALFARSGDDTPDDPAPLLPTRDQFEPVSQECCHTAGVSPPPLRYAGLVYLTTQRLRI